jgi:hypothetical protein
MGRDDTLKIVAAPSVAATSLSGIAQGAARHFFV